MMGIFDNATSVVIGNKEVQSIIGPNGEVFYQKPVSHNYTLSWSSASYTATGGSAVISCTLLDNGSPVSGATVSVSGSDGSLYSGITNSLGVVSFNVSYATNGTVTYTGSYSNVSSSCTVVYPVVVQDITLSEPLDSIILHQVSGDISDLPFLYAQELAEYLEDGPVTVNWLNNHQITFDELNMGAATSDNVTVYTLDFWDMDIDLVDYGITVIPLFAPIDYDGNVHRVEYSASDSTHLTITITDEVL